MYYIYFIFSHDEKYMKIGITNRMKVRLSSIQNGCPLPLKMGGYIEVETKAIAKARETEFHQKFSESNARGEWFSISPAISRWVRNNTTASDMTGNRRNGRPKKQSDDIFPKVHVTIRPDQKEKVAALKEQRRFSAVIQAAIDAA